MPTLMPSLSIPPPVQPVTPNPPQPPSPPSQPGGPPAWNIPPSSDAFRNYLWGVNGERWNPAGRLTDYSYAGERQRAGWEQETNEGGEGGGPVCMCVCACRRKGAYQGGT